MPVHIRKSPLALVVAAALALGSPQLLAQAGINDSPTASVAPQAYAIPAGELAPALRQLASQANLLVTFTDDQTRGKTTAGISGTYTPQEALNALLGTSGLQAVALKEGGYVLKAVPRSDVSVLKSVRIEADAISSTTTEGSNSYTPKAARTATKLNLSLRETPQTVTVLTRQRLDDLSDTGIKEVLSHVPGVYTTNNDTERTSIFSRGYSLSNYQVDGVPVVQGDGYISLNNDTYVYDRVDVLRGAAGLMTGNGDPSGYIALTRKMPTAEFQGSVGAGVGRWSYQRLQADFSGPLAFDGRLRGRAVLAKQESESFRDFYETERATIYGVLQFDVTDSTLVTVGYDQQEPESSGVTWGTLPYWKADGTKANMPRNANYTTTWSSWPVEQAQWFASVEQQFNEDWSLKVTYTDDQKDGDGKVWYGGNGYPAANGTGMTAWTMHSVFTVDTTAVDAVLNGAFSLFGRKHELVVGFSDSDSFNSAPSKLNDPVPADYLLVNDWRNWNGNKPVFGTTLQDFNAYEYDTEQQGLYAAGRFSILDPLTVIVGARLSDWAYETRSYNATGALVSRSGSEVDGEVTPYVGVVFDMTENLSAYASYTEIFKAQNYRDKDNNFIDPMVGDTSEAGIKGEFFDQRLNASLAYFTGKQDNLAELDDSLNLPAGSFNPNSPPTGYNGTGQFLLPDGSSPYRSTGEGNKVEGYELELQGAVTDSWNISGGYSETRVENAAGTRIQTDRPKQLVRLFTTYRFGDTLPGLEIGGGVSWQSELWRNANRPTGQLRPNGTALTVSERITQDSFMLANAMIRYSFNDQVSATLNVNNLFDKAYYRNVGFYNGVHWGEPMNWTARVQYKF